MLLANRVGYVEKMLALSRNKTQSTRNEAVANQVSDIATDDVLRRVLSQSFATERSKGSYLERAEETTRRLLGLKAFPKMPKRTHPLSRNSVSSTPQPCMRRKLSVRSCRVVLCLAQARYSLSPSYSRN